MENQVTEAAYRWPGVVVCPLGYGNESSTLGRIGDQRAFWGRDFVRDGMTAMIAVRHHDPHLFLLGVNDGNRYFVILVLLWLQGCGVVVRGPSVDPFVQIEKAPQIRTIF